MLRHPETIKNHVPAHLGQRSIADTPLAVATLKISAGEALSGQPQGPSRFMQLTLPFFSQLPMKAKRRTDERRDAELIEIAEMHRRGRPLAEIAQHFNLSKSQVSRDLKAIYGELFKANATEKARIRAEILAENKLMKKVLWEAYYRSVGDKEVQTKRKISTESSAGVAQNGESVEKGTERYEVSARTEGQVGNHSIIDSIGKCLDREARLQGVEQAEKVEVNIPQQINVVEVVRTVRESVKMAGGVEPNNLLPPLLPPPKEPQPNPDAIQIEVAPHE